MTAFNHFVYMHADIPLLIMTVFLMQYKSQTAFSDWIFRIRPFSEFSIFRLSREQPIWPFGGIRAVLQSVYI